MGQVCRTTRTTKVGHQDPGRTIGLDDSDEQIGRSAEQMEGPEQRGRTIKAGVEIVAERLDELTGTAAPVSRFGVAVALFRNRHAKPSTGSLAAILPVRRLDGKFGFAFISGGVT